MREIKLQVKDITNFKPKIPRVLTNKALIEVYLRESNLIKQEEKVTSITFSDSDNFTVRLD